MPYLKKVNYEERRMGQTEMKAGSATGQAAAPGGRITSIELLRFIAAIGVMLYHFGAVYLQQSGIYSTYAYVFVELFLMLTGFFMMQYLETHEDPLPPVNYLFRKIKSFYWMFLIMFGAQFIFYIRSYEIHGAGKLIKTFYHFKWEILLLQCSGALKNPAFNKDYLLGQDWYLSAMVLALLFIYPIACYYRRFYRTVFAPAVCIIFYALMIQYYGSLNVGSEYLGFISVGIIRGMAGVCLGSLAYLAWTHLARQESASAPASVSRTSAAPAASLSAASSGMSASAWKWLSLLEAFCWIAVLMLLGNGFYTSDVDLPVYLIIFFVLILLCCLSRTVIARFLNTHVQKLLSVLGRLSLCIYLTHWTVMTAMNAFVPGLAASLAIPVYLAATLLLSFLLLRLSSWKQRTAAAAVLFISCMTAALILAL